MDTKAIIRKRKKLKYYRERAKLWKEFKKENANLQCGLVKENKEYGYIPYLWEYDCTNNSCYDKDFFEKYGCMYVKGFMDY